MRRVGQPCPIWVLVLCLALPATSSAGNNAQSSPPPVAAAATTQVLQAQGERINGLAPLAEEINAQLSAYKQRLDEMAGNVALQAAFAQKDTAALERSAEQWQADIDHALRLRLLLPGQPSLDLDGTPPLGFASVQLLENLQQGQAVPVAEVHRPGTEQAHVVMARAVMGADGSVIGLIHLSLSTELLQSIMSRVVVAGHVTLEQKVGRRTVLLGESGQLTDPQQREQIATQDIPDSSWTVQHWRTGFALFGEDVSFFDSITLPSINVLITLLVLCIVVLVFYRRRYGHVGHGAERMPAGATREERKTGASKSLTGSKLAWVSQLVQSIQGSLRTSGSAPAVHGGRRRLRPRPRQIAHSDEPLPQQEPDQGAEQPPPAVPSSEHAPDEGRAEPSVGEQSASASSEPKLAEDPGKSASVPSELKIAEDPGKSASVPSELKIAEDPGKSASVPSELKIAEDPGKSATSAGLKLAEDPDKPAVEDSARPAASSDTSQK